MRNDMKAEPSGRHPHFTAAGSDPRPRGSVQLNCRRPPGMNSEIRKRRGNIHLLIANLLRCTCAENCEHWLKVDKVIEIITRVQSFLDNRVELLCYIHINTRMNLICLK